ncbi:hypothetical protein CRG98_023862 [Punica granatum]|uniref:Uncharacterized protein n=1 Tax=Punica granatum TaxID=22663 RepID=A0A2I0JIJ0_PUNGR|nr:hypothetical protein CRG98_023862 [Punica granatum]
MQYLKITHPSELHFSVPMSYTLRSPKRCKTTEYICSSKKSVERHCMAVDALQVLPKSIRITYINLTATDLMTDEDGLNRTARRGVERHFQNVVFEPSMVKDTYRPSVGPIRWTCKHPNPRKCELSKQKQGNTSKYRGVRHRKGKWAAQLWDSWKFSSTGSSQLPPRWNFRTWARLVLASLYGGAVTNRTAWANCPNE